jgi:hypothetical protein
MDPSIIARAVTGFALLGLATPTPSAHTAAKLEAELLSILSSETR